MHRIFSASIKKVFARFGYDIRAVRPALEQKPGYALYTYWKQDGTLDYEKYRQMQMAGNRRKIDHVWVIEENIAFLAQHIKRIVGTPRFGLCHGTRRGLEQAWFKKYLDCEALGTEISDTAHQFPDTIQWDFHETKPEWIEAVDFIYSNSFDHTYDPEKCLNAWMKCLRKGGICILEHSSGHEAATVTPLDPFGADMVVMPYLIVMWGKGQYGIREMIEAPRKSSAVRYLYFFIVQKW